MKFDSVNVMSEIVQHVSEDDPLWVQLTDQVRLRPLMFDCTNGAWSNADAIGHSCNETRRLYCFQQ